MRAAPAARGTDLERVFGKRMLRILELPANTPLKADLIKKLTGGERWPIRTLYKSFYEFTPSALAKAQLPTESYAAAERVCRDCVPRNATRCCQIDD
jgi:hypothetical protein